MLKLGKLDKSIKPRWSKLSYDDKKRILDERKHKAILKQMMRVSVPGIMQRAHSIDELCSQLIRV